MPASHVKLIILYCVGEKWISIVAAAEKLTLARS